MIRDVIHVVSLVALLAWLVFLVWYSLRAKWWRSPEGRNVWGVASALVIALGMVNASYIWPDYAARDWVVLGVYAYLAALAVQRTVQMERRQRHKNDVTH
ncbi:hypothetical protein [Isoptericola sp. NPDC056605]|uniref:putative phage holin n=1 Tax=Isoptericola sp. NPDC056605 TaxID=3345876 RepID=UPI0036CE5622